MFGLLPRKRMSGVPPAISKVSKEEKGEVPMHLTLLPLQADDVLRVRLDGPITLRFAGPGEEPLQALLGPNCYGHKMELDCGGARCIDTSGLSWLTLLTHNFRAAGGQLVLSHVPPAVLDVFRFLGLGSFFGFTPEQPHPEDRPSRQAPTLRTHSCASQGERLAAAQGQAGDGPARRRRRRRGRNAAPGGRLGRS